MSRQESRGERLKRERRAYWNRMLNMIDDESQELDLYGTNLDQLLVQAAKEGEKEVVDALLENHLIDAAYHHNAPLRAASEEGHTAIVERLLMEEEVNPRAQDSIAFRNAARRGRTDVIRAFLEDDRPLRDRADPAALNSEALRIAAFNGHLPVVQLLLETRQLDPQTSRVTYGVDVSANNYAALRNAVRGARGHSSQGVEITRLLLKAGSDATVEDSSAFVSATESGNVAILRLLLEAGANPTTHDNAALRRAAELGYAQIVQWLLELGADPTALESEAIRHAAKHGELAVVQVLLRDGRANPAARNNEAIRGAAEQVQYGPTNEDEYWGTIALLLFDSRVQAAGLPRADLFYDNPLKNSGDPLARALGHVLTLKWTSRDTVAQSLARLRYADPNLASSILTFYPV